MIEQPPTPGKFAFLVHPRSDVAADMARVWRPLGRIPARTWERGLRRLPVPPLRLGSVHRRDTASGEPDGWLIVVPATPRQLLGEDRRWVVERVESAVDRAEALGARVVGLGALTAPATRAGRLLRERPAMTVTTGNAFTAHLTVEGLRRLAAAASGSHLAIVGATGSVGSCVVRLLADEPLGSDLTLVSRGGQRLEDLATEVRGSGVAVRTSTSMDAVRDADVVLVLTSAADALLGSGHLKRGALVLDDTQPRNTDPRLREERPDVLVVDGGVAAVPGIDIRGDIGLPRGRAYACLCETMLMAFDGVAASATGQDRWTGEASVAHARRMRDAARRFAHLGFTLADPLSFGRPAAWPTPAAASPVRGA